MSETTVAPQSVTSTEEKKPIPGNIVSRGPVTPTSLTAPKPAEAAAAAGGEAETPEAKAAREAAELEAKNKLPDLTDDQKNKLLAESLGLKDWDGNIDALKEKLNTPAATNTPPEQTPEEKAAAEAAFEKRMLDFFIASGGTAESFVAFKQVAAMDLKALSESEIRRELKEAGFEGDDINKILVERYYQINPSELVRDEENETEDEFNKRKAAIEKKIAFGSKDFETKGSYTKKQAENALNALREAVKLQDLQKEEEIKHSNGVKEFFTKLPRKVSFQLGKTDDGQDLPPVDYNIKEDDVTAIQSALADPVQRKQLLFNEDNSLNLAKIGEVLLKNKYLEDALKESYLSGNKSGRDEQVAIFEKTFPGRIAKEIGVGGASGGGQNARKGHIVSRGAPETVRR